MVNLVGFNFKTVRLVSMNKCNALLVGPIKCLRFWAQKVYHRHVKNYDTVDYEMQFLKNSETLQEASNKIIRPSIEENLARNSAREFCSSKDLARTFTIQIFKLI